MTTGVTIENDSINNKGTNLEKDFSVDKYFLWTKRTEFLIKI